MTRNRWIAVVSAVVLVVGGGGLALGLSGSGPSGHVTLSEEPLPSDSPTPEESPTPSPSPSPTASPTPSPTPVETATETEAPSAPSTTTTPRPAPTRSPSGSGDTGDLGPAPPGSAFAPHHPGQLHWTATSHGIAFDVTLSHAARAGAPVSFTVRLHGPEQDCCAAYLVYGDGFVYPENGTDCALPKTGGSTTTTVAHTYNKPGPHRMLVQAIADRCNDNGALYLTVDVGDGPSTSQGPQLPDVDFQSSVPPDPNPGNATVTLYALVKEADGYLTKLVVDYGDGSAKVTFPTKTSCTPTRDGWPAPTQEHLPGDPNMPTHHYAKPGHYTLTLTAYSSGCDGKQVQTGTGSFTWDVTA